MATEKTGLIAKVLNLLQTRRRAPPPELGDGKYDSEESGNTVKSGVIRELEGSKLSVPEELDLYLELVAIAKAGGEDLTIAEMAWPQTWRVADGRSRGLWVCLATTGSGRRSWLSQL
jgi:hypothetical protein